MRWMSLTCVLGLVPVCIQAGCAKVEASKMVPSGLELGTQTDRSCSVRVMGNSALSPEVRGGVFEQALAEALRNSKLFSTTAPRDSGEDYRLTVSVREYDGSKLHTRWVLLSGRDETMVWEASLSQSGGGGVATVATRANRACRATIEEALTRMSQCKDLRTNTPD